MKIRLFFAVALLVFCAFAAQAVTYVVPSDRDLVKSVDAVVIGSALNSYSQLNAAGSIETVTTFGVEQVISGDVQGEIAIHQPGGVYGDQAMVIAGVPRFTAGQRTLLLLRRTPAGEWAVLDIALGKFNIITDRLGRELAIRDEGEVDGWDPSGVAHVEKPRMAKPFIDFLRTETHGGVGNIDYFLDRAPLAATTDSVAAPKLKAATNVFLSSSYTSLLSNNTAPRWQTFGAGVQFKNENTLAAAAGGGVTAIQTGVGRWNGINGGVNYVYCCSEPGTHMNGILGAADGVNTVIFEVDLTSVGAPNYNCATGGVLGLGGVKNAAGVFTFNGESFTAIQEVDIAMNKGLNACGSGTYPFAGGGGDFNTAVTHEMGHTLGLRHSDQTRADDPGTPCSTDPSLDCSSSSIMKAAIVNGINAQPQTWDKCAIQYLYGTCTPPTVNTQPSNQTITSGAQASLSVGITSPVITPTYQWYTGTSGNTASPVAGQTAATFAPSPTTTTSYWVRSTTCCGTVDSNTATVTVSGGGCTAPQITTQPTGSTVSSGSPASLTVAASGTATLAYQWYIGASGVTTTPVTTNGTSATLNVSSVTTTTKYWCLVSNGCGSANSNAATITVTGGCVAPSITTQPVGQSSTPGSQVSLFVAAGGTGPFTYQWYTGASGNTSQPVPTGATSATLNVAPSVTTTYWCRVTNGCGSADSNSATVIVNANCVAPVITGDPQDQQVTSGSMANLSLGYAGTPGIVTWYRGTKPDKSSQAGTGISISVGPITQTTQFWAEVSNTCGAAQTRTMTVSVTVTCIAPAITSATATPSSTNGGATVALAVVATGSSLQYQWYKGQPQDTSAPLANGNTANVTDTPPATTTYWVRVSNTCGSADSGPVTVTVSSCATVVVTVLTPNVTISSNSGAQLAVSAKGGTTFHYAWFKGPSGDESHPVGTDKSTYTTDPLLATGAFWVRVTNDCSNSTNSPTINVNVIPAKHRASKH